MNNKRNHLVSKTFLSFILIVVLIFCFSTIALSATASDTTQQDLSEIKELVFYYSIYDASDNMASADNLEDYMKAFARVDKYARYYSSTAFPSFLAEEQGEMIGIGISFQVVDEGVEVLSVMDGSPAELSGITEGDIITYCNDQSLAGLTSDEIVDIFSGEENTMVVLKVKSSDGTVKQHVLLRTTIILDTVDSYMQEAGIGYLKISQFTEHTGEQFGKAVKELEAEGAKGIIIDLRNCPGGSLDGVVDACSYFVPEGPVVFLEQALGDMYYISAGYDQITLPIAVLVNSNTASASELLSANIQDSGSGVVIGTQTYGKGIAQSIIPLSSGAGVVMTTARYRSAGYQNIDANKGVTPNIYVEDETTQMQKAIAWLKNQKQVGDTVSFVLSSKTMYVDGTAQPLSVVAYSSNGTSYLPARAALEALGWTVDYYDNTLYVVRGADRFVISLSDGQVVFQGKVLTQKAVVKNGSVYLPSAVFSSLNANVKWNSQLQQITITIN